MVLGGLPKNYTRVREHPGGALLDTGSFADKGIPSQRHFIQSKSKVKGWILPFLRQRYIPSH